MSRMRQRRWPILILLILALYVAWTDLTARRGALPVSFRPARETCGASGPLRYCVYADPAGTSDDVIYHLHGRNLDERVWNDNTYFPAMLQAEWQSAGIRPPRVVTLSYGDVWLLTPRGRSAESGLLDDLMRRLPEIEGKFGRPRRRLLLGESMGGLNVLIAGLSRPSSFAKIAALCPGVYIDSPFAPLATIRATMTRTGADPRIVFGIWMMARKYVADDAEWRQVAPLRLIEQAEPGFPALYLSNGLYDAYGNFEGSQRLAARARARSVRTEWHPLYGGHCAIDIPSLARFLVT